MLATQKFLFPFIFEWCRPDALQALHKLVEITFSVAAAQPLTAGALTVTAQVQILSVRLLGFFSSRSHQ
jgi:hypothetical protein